VLDDVHFLAVLADPEDGLVGFVRSGLEEGGEFCAIGIGQAGEKGDVAEEVGIGLSFGGGGRHKKIEDRG
jgi:hypothetical protein